MGTEVRRRPRDIHRVQRATRAHGSRRWQRRWTLCTQRLGRLAVAPLADGVDGCDAAHVACVRLQVLYCQRRLRGVVYLHLPLLLCLRACQLHQHLVPRQRPIVRPQHRLRPLERQRRGGGRHERRRQGRDGGRAEGPPWCRRLAPHALPHGRHRTDEEHVARVGGQARHHELPHTHRHSQGTEHRLLLASVDAGLAPRDLVAAERRVVRSHRGLRPLHHAGIGRGVQHRRWLRRDRRRAERPHRKAGSRGGALPYLVHLRHRELVQAVAQ